jgi:hypothetical protein
MLVALCAIEQIFVPLLSFTFVLIVSVQNLPLFLRLETQRMGMAQTKG